MSLRAIVLLCFLLLAPVCGRAQDTVAIPPVDEKLLEDGTPFTVSPDGPAMVRLSEDAASVIIGNPKHASAMVENPRLVMLMPGKPGATTLTVLNNAGKVVLNRKVLVGGGAAGKTLKINRVCASGSNSCAPTTVYSCAGKCYQSEIANDSDVTAGSATTPPPAPVSAAPQAAQPPAAPLATPAAVDDIENNDIPAGVAQ